MPIYVYKCECGNTIEDFLSTYNPKKTAVCANCGKNANRSFSSERKNTDLVNNERWSESMGVMPEQVPEAMTTFPGSTYDSEGRLLIKNRKHKLFEAKRRGYAELD